MRLVAHYRGDERVLRWPELVAQSTYLRLLLMHLIEHGY